ncbi:MAG: hypothetical protein LOD91_04450 [Limnochordales bacterium]|nr:hypothetical protein [Limnochordales bacterium]
MRRPTAATIVFGSLVLLGFVLLATVLLPLSGAGWSLWGADGLFYHYLTEFF